MTKISKGVTSFNVATGENMEINKTCKWCGETVVWQNPNVPEGLHPMHSECSIRSIAGSVGHQSKRCSCYGGTLEDPPGATKREAAITATFYFRTYQGNNPN